MMPPSGAPRPRLRRSTDSSRRCRRRSIARRRAGRIAGAPALHRLNRAEYSNAIRDLLALDVDAASLLPPDDSAAGFDNIADVLGVSPALIEGYATAAAKISRLAVGDPTHRARSRHVSSGRQSRRRRSTSTACRSAPAAA